MDASPRLDLEGLFPLSPVTIEGDGPLWLMVLTSLI